MAQTTLGMVLPIRFQIRKTIYGPDAKAIYAGEAFLAGTRVRLATLSEGNGARTEKAAISALQEKIRDRNRRYSA